MASRLKRKLGELGVDTSSRKANENFCLIGTPLPPLEKSKDTGEFVPLWKQEVRDEKGRRRLHGAFTGGFSAGYFNTVGSKEGWTPSTFVSSRGDRAKKQATRPEDFMDDEDLQDLKDSRNIVADETEDIDIFRGTQEELQSKNGLPVLQVNRKDNSHGLGYVPGPTLNESLNDNSGTSQGPILAGGFGLGALNDAEDDDLDVYDHSHQQSRRNVAYDRGDDDDTTVIIGAKGDKKNIVQERSASSVQYFRDGRPVTIGFILSNEPVAEDRWFPLPDVPPGWTPDPKKLWASEDSEKEKQLSKPLPGLEHGKWKRSHVSAHDRGVILGEITPPSAPRSIFEYISEKDRERLKRITSGLTAPPSEPPISKKEPEDYAKAASLFKPISGAMASRFTSASTVEFGPKAHEGLHVPSNEEIAAKEAQRVKEEEDKISPKAHAAKMGMFGPLTRETKPWQPASRLCKRFGVKPPDLPPDMPSEGSSNKAGPSFTQIEQIGPVPTSAEDTTVAVQQPGGPRDLANIGLGEDETQGQDTLTYERPSMDIFKAIFASDDEDSDEEQDKKPELDQQPVLPPLSTHNALAGLVTDDIPVDLSTFKPTFIPRERKSKNKERSKEKKEKKERKGVLVSFAMDEDGMESAQPKQSKDRPKKKRKDKKVGEGDEDVSMWADKPPPEVITVAPAVRDISPGPKGRKRAIDFM